MTESIRAATNADTKQIRELIFGVLTEYGLPPEPDNTDADLKDIEANYIQAGGVFEIIEIDQSIVGTAALFPIDSETCELRKMYFAKSARGKGLGKKLLQRLLNKAKDLGFKRVELETAGVLKEAIGLYKAFGFKELRKDHLPSRCDQAFVLELD